MQYRIRKGSPIIRILSQINPIPRIDTLFSSIARYFKAHNLNTKFQERERVRERERKREKYREKEIERKKIERKKERETCGNNYREGCVV